MIAIKYTRTAVGCFIAFFLFPLFVSAQSKITGKLVDGITREPVSSATVYVDQTQLSTLSDTNGFFRLNGVPAKAVIIVTHTSYQKVRTEIDDVHDTLVLELFRSDIALANVTLQAKTKDTWQKWGRHFTNILIGEGIEKECVLQNPQDVRFRYDKDQLLLKAFARKPLLVENRMLGYTVHIDLDSLVFHLGTGSFSYTLSEYFEFTRPGDETGQRKMAANRLQAFRGSRMHFSRALFNRNLEEEGFHLYQYKGILNTEKSRVETLILKTRAGNNGYNQESPVDQVDLRAFGNDTALYFKNVLQQPNYFFQDSLSVNLTDRWTAGTGSTALFYVGFDSLLLVYKEKKGGSVPDQLLNKWARMKEPGAAIKNNYAFLPAVGGRDKFSLLYLLSGDRIAVRSNGHLENVGQVFIEGYLAGNRLAYDLPWDYDPEADEHLLVNDRASLVSGAGTGIEKSLSHIAASRSSTELYLHLDKTTYDGGENIWFAAYVLRSPFKPEEHHTLYVFLQNPETKKNIVEEKFVLAAGQGAGYIFLPDSLAPGTYHLIAYTNTLPGEHNPVVFDQAIVLRPQIQPFTVNYSESTNQYRNDSVFIVCKVKNESGHYASGAEVSYRLTDKGKMLASGKAKINDYGELAVKGIPLQAAAGKKLTLLTDLQQNKQKYQLQNEFLLNGNYVRIRWYPEGGELVNGLPAKLSYEISDLYDQPLAVQCRLLKNKNFVSDLNTDGSGAGLVEITPVAGDEYSVQLFSDSLVMIENNFPVALTAGYSIFAEKGVVEDSLRFLIRSTRENAKLYVLVHDYKAQYYFDKMMVRVKEKRITLPAGMLPEGLATITLFEENGRPVAERTIFKEPAFRPELKIELDSSLYHSRSKVQVKVKATDGAGNPVQSVFSLACVLNSRIDTTRFQDIVSFNYLNSYRAAGVIVHKPDYFQYNRGRMERFLLIQCWTRYKWQSLDSAATSSKPPLYSLVQKGQVLYKGSKPGKPVEVIIITPGSAATIYTDSSGYFEIDKAMLTTEPDWKISLAVNAANKADYSILLMNDNDALQNKLATVEYPVPHTVKYVPEEIAAPFVKSLAPVIIKSKGSNDGVDGLTQRIKKMVGRCDDYVCMYNILNCVNHPNGRKPQKGGYYLVRKDGLMIGKIYERCSDGSALENSGSLNNDTVIFQLKGRYYSKEFYVADYGKYNPYFPETLTTLYWNPLIQTDEKGEAAFSFYTNDLKGRLVLIAEGVGGGSVLSARRILRVVQ